jgi:hypothetical protein
MRKGEEKNGKSGMPEMTQARRGQQQDEMRI